MKNKTRNSIFFIFSNLLIFLFMELVFTVFFIYHHSNYYGFLAKIFVDENNHEEVIDEFAMKWNKHTDKWKPGVYNIRGHKIKINSKGFIGEEFSEENKKNCRIISFGSSVTAGIGTKPYPKILEEKFQKNNINCEVLNFGFGGKSLNFLENLLVNEAIDYNPDIITIMSNRSATMYDSYGNSSVTPDIIENKFDYFVYKTNRFLFSQIMTYRFSQLSYRRIVSKFYDQENKIVDPYYPKNFHLKNYFTSKYINQMTNILNFCRSRGIKVVFIKQGHYIDPTYQKSLEVLPHEEIIEKLMTYNKETERDSIDLFWIYTNLILNNALEKIKSENDEAVLADPIDRLYSSEKNFSGDGLHLTSNGNEIVADELMKSITKTIDLPSV